MAKTSALLERDALPEEDFVDPRVRRTRAAVLKAAIALARERGYIGCTIEAIAERTGVARTTIYRHWPGRAELLVDAINSTVYHATLPDTGALRSDLLEYFADRSSKMARDHLNLGLHTLNGIADASRRDPALGVVAEQMRELVFRNVTTILKRGKARGELAKNTDLGVMAKVLLGAVFLQRGILNQTLTTPFLTAVVDAAIYGMGVKA